MPKVLIILDGLDEYQETISIVNRLLGIDDGEPSDDWYTGCKILVTSRPTATRINDVRRWSHANYELMGFDSARMKSFVARALAANPFEDKKVTAAELCGIIAADPDLAARARRRTRWR